MIKRPLQPSISVVVATYNRSVLLDLCLQSLQAQTLPRGDYEVVVVDNACTDDTPRVVADHAASMGCLRRVAESRLGLSHARNTGLRESRGAIVAFLDDDARAAPDWLARIREAFATVTPSPGVVGGPAFPQFEHPPPAWHPHGLYQVGAGEEARFVEPWDLAGVNMACDRRRALDLGGFAADLGMTGKRIRLGEDTDFLIRAHRAGNRIWYDPAIRVDEHWIPRSRTTVRYHLTRRFFSGAAWSRIRGARLLSLRAARHACLLVPALARMSSPAPHDTNRALTQAASVPSDHGRKQRFFLLSLYLADRAGRIWGARLF